MPDRQCFLILSNSVTLSNWNKLGLAIVSIYSQLALFVKRRDVACSKM